MCKILSRERWHIYSFAIELQNITWLRFFLLTFLFLLPLHKQLSNRIDIKHVQPNHSEGHDLLDSLMSLLDHDTALYRQLSHCVGVVKLIIALPTQGIVLEDASVHQFVWIQEITRCNEFVNLLAC